MAFKYKIIKNDEGQNISVKVNESTIGSFEVCIIKDKLIDASEIEDDVWFRYIKIANDILYKISNETGLGLKLY